MPLTADYRLLCGSFPTRPICNERHGTDDHERATTLLKKKSNNDNTIEYWYPSPDGLTRKVIWLDELFELPWPLDSGRFLEKEIVVGQRAARTYLNKNYYILTSLTGNRRILTNATARRCLKKGNEDCVLFADIAGNAQD